MLTDCVVSTIAAALSVARAKAIATEIEEYQASPATHSSFEFLKMNQLEFK